MSQPAQQMVDGFRIPAMFSADAFRSAVSYRPRDDDVFIVSYPKCGTTWSQHILTLILQQGRPLTDDWDFFGASPFLDRNGAKAAETMPCPGAIKLHLPFHLTPWSDRAKYVYVTRNPKDACVSFFHQYVPGHKFQGTFDEFFELFLSGNVDYGDYFDHLLGWYEHRNDPNVLFLTYEEVKEDPEEAILKIASFIDDGKFAEPLRQDRQKLENVVKYSSFQKMKVSVNKRLDELLSLSAEDAAKTGLPDEMVKMKSKMEEMKSNGEMAKKPDARNFVRKGIVGDWRNHFSEDQSKRMDEKFAQRTKGTEIAHYWKKYI